MYSYGPPYMAKQKQDDQPYSLPIYRGRIIEFIHFPMVLVLCEMQSVSSRIWIRVVVSISYDDNHYTRCNLFVIHNNHFQVFAAISNYS